MKKDRNSFFSGYGFNSANNGINPNMMMPNNEVSANSSFYAGPGMPNNMNPNMYSDIDARLSKLERQVNRLETRVNQLEGNNNDTNVTENSYSANMYMV
jgi:hypothetical protein